MYACFEAKKNANTTQVSDLIFSFLFQTSVTPQTLINFSMAAKQYELHGAVTNSMALVCAFQGWYVFDAFLSEVRLLLAPLYVCLCWR